VQAAGSPSALFWKNYNYSGIKAVFISVYEHVLQAAINQYTILMSFRIPTFFVGVRNL